MPKTAQRPDADELLTTMPLLLVQWPMIAFAAWWGVAFEPGHSARRAHLSRSRHGLTVPEAIEHDGEHALFA